MEHEKKWGPKLKKKDFKSKILKDTKVSIKRIRTKLDTKIKSN
jgi:hypothetical protein